MDVTEKIAREVKKEITKILNKYIYKGDITKLSKKGINLYSGSHLGLFLNGHAPWSWIPVIKERNSSLLRTEIRRCHEMKVMDLKTRNKLLKMATSDEGMMNLCKVLVNNYRNKRIKKEANGRRRN